MSTVSSEPVVEEPVPKTKLGRWPFKHGSADGFGRPWRVILNTILIFLVSQIVAAFIVAFVGALRHHGHAAVDLLSSSNLSQFFFVLIAEGSAAGLVLWALKRRKIKLSQIGLGRLPAWKDLKWAAGGAVLFYAVLIVGSIILSLFVSQSQLNKQQDVGFNDITTTLDSILAFLALVVLPPLGEETLVRGYLYSGLRKTWRFWPALLVTSVLFGLAHLDGGAGGTAVWAASFDTFMLSVVLVYVRDHSGALYAGMLIHSLNNLIAFGIHFKGVLF